MFALEVLMINEFEGLKLHCTGHEFAQVPIASQPGVFKEFCGITTGEEYLDSVRRTLTPPPPRCWWLTRVRPSQSMITDQFLVGQHGARCHAAARVLLHLHLHHLPPRQVPQVAEAMIGDDDRPTYLLLEIKKRQNIIKSGK
jgi:hypothetical protein